PADFYAPVPLTITTTDGRSATVDPGPISGHEGLVYQAAHLAQLVADGTTDSPLLPLGETVGILTTTGEIRGPVGLSYPGEYPGPHGPPGHDLPRLAGAAATRHRRLPRARFGRHLPAHPPDRT